MSQHGHEASGPAAAGSDANTIERKGGNDAAANAAGSRSDAISIVRKGKLIGYGRLLEKEATGKHGGQYIPRGYSRVRVLDIVEPTLQDYRNQIATLRFRDAPRNDDGSVDFTFKQEYILPFIPKALNFDEWHNIKENCLRLSCLDFEENEKESVQMCIDSYDNLATFELKQCILKTIEEDPSVTYGRPFAILCGLVQEEQKKNDIVGTSNGIGSKQSDAQGDREDQDDDKTVIPEVSGEDVSNLNRERKKRKVDSDSDGDADENEDDMDDANDDELNQDDPHNAERSKGKSDENKRPEDHKEDKTYSSRFAHHALLYLS